MTHTHAHEWLHISEPSVASVAASGGILRLIWASSHVPGSDSTLPRSLDLSRCSRFAACRVWTTGALPGAQGWRPSGSRSCAGGGATDPQRGPPSPGGATFAASRAAMSMSFSNARWACGRSVGVLHLRGGVDGTAVQFRAARDRRSRHRFRGPYSSGVRAACSSWQCCTGRGRPASRAAPACRLTHATAALYPRHCPAATRGPPPTTPSTPATAAVHRVATYCTPRRAARLVVLR